MPDRKKIIEEISNFFNSLGINAIYICTFFLVLISYSDLKKLKRWDKISFYEKFLIISTWMATAMMLVGSLIFGFHDLGIW